MNIQGEDQKMKKIKNHNLSVHYGTNRTKIKFKRKKKKLEKLNSKTHHLLNTSTYAFPIV